MVSKSSRVPPTSNTGALLGATWASRSRVLAAGKSVEGISLRAMVIGGSGWLETASDYAIDIPFLISINDQ